MRIPNPARINLRTVHLVSALLAVALVSGLVLRVSAAAFTAETSNTGNTFAADQIALTDNDADSVMFALADMIPSDPAEERCITVTYDGANAADVRTYGVATGDLAPYLQLTVEYQDGVTGAFADCTGFTADGVAYTGTLDGFATDHADYATGAASFTATDGDTRMYRFVVSLADDDAAQGLTAGADVVFEARTS